MEGWKKGAWKGRWRDVRGNSGGSHSCISSTQGGATLAVQMWKNKKKSRSGNSLLSQILCKLMRKLPRYVRSEIYSMFAQGLLSCLRPWHLPGSWVGYYSNILPSSHASPSPRCQPQECQLPPAADWVLLLHRSPELFMYLYFWPEPEFFESWDLFSFTFLFTNCPSRWDFKIW